MTGKRAYWKILLHHKLPRSSEIPVNTLESEGIELRIKNQLFSYVLKKGFHFFVNCMKCQEFKARDGIFMKHDDNQLTSQFIGTGLTEEVIGSSYPPANPVSGNSSSKHLWRKNYYEIFFSQPSFLEFFICNIRIEKFTGEYFSWINGFTIKYRSAHDCIKIIPFWKIPS